MLGIGFPDRHALPYITPKKCTDREPCSPPARAGSFVGATLSPEQVPAKVRNPTLSGRSCCPVTAGADARLRTFTANSTGEDRQGAERPEPHFLKT